MILTTELIKQVVTSFFEKKPVKKIWLFGSYARGEANDESDVDVLVDIEYIPGIGSDFFKWNDELAEKLHKRVDIVSAGWENKHIKPFMDEDKFIIYERYRHSEVDWSNMIGFSNIAVQQYFAINYKIVWDAATIFLKGLKPEIEAINV